MHNGKLLNRIWQRGILIFCLGFVAVVFVLREVSLSQTETRNDFIQIPAELVMSGDPIKLPQASPYIKKFIKDRGFLQPPSTEPYNLDFPDKDPSIGQGEMVRKLLKFQRDGFFIESGALDGETHSNTLYLETHFGWTGLLVEPDPVNYERLTKKNRKAWISNSCLATKPHPHKVKFEQNFNVGKISSEWNETSNFIECQCFPLYSILTALSITTVDYFSLDVEGVEMEVLENIPFDKIFFKVISVEFSHASLGKQGMRKFFEDKGFVYAGELAHPQEPHYANDFIFIHRRFSHLIPANKNDLMPIESNTDLPCVDCIARPTD